MKIPVISGGNVEGTEEMEGPAESRETNQDLGRKIPLNPLNPRIVGGQDASPGSSPWMVSFNDEDGLFCAGSLITDKYVLTAAHCVTG